MADWDDGYAKGRADERDVNEALADLRANARLRAKVEALLEQAKRERDAQPKVDQRDSPYLYGNNMHAGGRVVGIAEVLFTLLDGGSA